MDVTCDRCGTDYEFEETLVSTRGTTVKCTSCGHLFKVYKPGAPQDGEPGDVQKWTVRKGDGSIHRLASLGDLTRLIGEGAFSRDDEVSRTGKAWKKLGEIDELTGFFPDQPAPAPEAPASLPAPAPAAPAASASIPVPAGPRQRRSTLPPELGLRTNHPPEPGLPRGVGSLPPRAAGPEAPDAPSRVSAPAPPPARFETMGGQVELDARGAVRNIEQTPPVVSSRASFPSGDLDAATTSRRRAVSVATSLPAPPAARPPEPRDSSSSYMWLLALLILTTATAAAGLLLWPKLQERMKPTTPADPTAEFIARADAAFATHRVQHFEDAITDYTKALGFHESDPHILSSLSRVYAVWAQELRFKALALRRAARNDVEHRTELAALDKEQRQLAEQAKRYAENAARKNPGNEEAEIALADALRLNGNLVAARSELDRARATQSTQSGETLRVSALLAIDEAKGELQAGTKLASQAVAQEPELIRTRLLLSRCLIADKDMDGARYQLSAVQTRDRSHPGALLVQQELERALAPAPPPTPATTADAAAAENAEVDPGEHIERMKYDELITRGQRMLEVGNVALAKRMFEQALFTRPSSGSAHTGLGYVALEKGRPQLAVEHFLPAARAGNLEALIGLGDAYRRIDRPRDALKAYQKYLAREPSGPRSNIARSQVDRLTDELGGSR